MRLPTAFPSQRKGRINSPSSSAKTTVHAETAERRRRYRRGRNSELIAGVWLQLKGYRILARRYKCVCGEIDLIARRFGCVIFVEVKRRARLADAQDAITWEAQERITAAADIWLSRHPSMRHLEPRFDAVFLAPGRLPLHCRDAFRY